MAQVGLQAPVVDWMTTVEVLVPIWVQQPLQDLVEIGKSIF